MAETRTLPRPQGLYARFYTPGGFAWGEAAQLIEGPPDSPGAAALQAAHAAATAEEPQPQLLTLEVAAALYGAPGVGTLPELMSEGLRQLRARAVDLYPAIPPAQATVDAVRAYGDFLSLHHETGQTRPDPALAHHHPYQSAPSGQRRLRAADLIPPLPPEAPTPPLGSPEPPPPRSAALQAVREGAELAREHWGVTGGAVAATGGVVLALLLRRP